MKLSECTRTLVAVGATLVVFQAASGPVQACVGARAIAMGGAYTAVAQGALAAYWNPAALAFSEKNEATITFPVGARDVYNYDAFAAYSEKYNGKLAGAVSVAHSGAVGPLAASLGYSHTSYAYSLATRVGSRLGVGGTLRYERETQNDLSGAGSALAAKGIGADLGLTYKTSAATTVGVLVQDVSSTRMVWSNGAEERYGINFRPGVAWTPNPLTTLSFEWYNLGAGILPWASADSEELRLGAEHVFLRQAQLRKGSQMGLAIRAGASHTLAAHETVVTAGFGLSLPIARISGALSIDYACKGIWSSSGLTPVHLVGLSFSF